MGKFNLTKTDKEPNTLRIGTSEGYVEISGTNEFLQRVFTDLLNHDGSLMQQIMLESISETFETREEIEAFFAKAQTEGHASI